APRAPQEYGTQGPRPRQHRGAQRGPCGVGSRWPRITRGGSTAPGSRTGGGRAASSSTPRAAGAATSRPQSDRGPGQPPTERTTTRSRTDRCVAVRCARGARSARTSLALAATLAGLVPLSALGQRAVSPAFTADELTAWPTDGWITNGGNVFNQRYSPLRSEEHTSELQ